MKEVKRASTKFVGGANRCFLFGVTWYGKGVCMETRKVVPGVGVEGWARWRTPRCMSPVIGYRAPHYRKVLVIQCGGESSEGGGWLRCLNLPWLHVSLHVLCRTLFLFTTFQLHVFPNDEPYITLNCLKV